MFRLLSLILVCLCLQLAVAQTDSSQSFEKFKARMESYMDKELKIMRQPLPSWFTTPVPDEYVGCSFPSDIKETLQDTAELSTILNYLANNWKAGIRLSVQSISSFANPDDNGISQLLSDIGETKVDTTIVFPLKYNIIGKSNNDFNTFVAMKVDTTKNDITCNMSISLSDMHSSTIRKDQELLVLSSILELRLNFSNGKKYKVSRVLKIDEPKELYDEAFLIARLDKEIRVSGQRKGRNTYDPCYSFWQNVVEEIYKRILGF